jgi:hypothetical protein
MTDDSNIVKGGKERLSGKQNKTCNFLKCTTQCSSIMFSDNSHTKYANLRIHILTAD